MDNLLPTEKKQQQRLISNTNSILSSFTVSNLDNSYNNNYDIYEKNYNYNKNQKNKLLDDSNSIRLFDQGIKDNQFYNNKNQSFLTLTDIDNKDTNSINLLNNTMTDNSTFSDLKKIFKEYPIEKKDDDDDGDELEVDSFLLEDNKNYFQYGPQEKNKNNYSEIKSYIQDDDENVEGKKNIGKKKIKYVFEIKIEDEPKKLIIRRGDDKNNIIKNFCKKYGLDDIEKKKILEVIDEQLKNLNEKMKKKV